MRTKLYVKDIINIFNYNPREFIYFRKFSSNLLGKGKCTNSDTGLCVAKTQNQARRGSPRVQKMILPFKGKTDLNHPKIT